MKKKGTYEIIIRGKSGIETTMIRKTWKGTLSLLTRLETECHNIWRDAFLSRSIRQRTKMKLKKQ